MEKNFTALLNECQSDLMICAIGFSGNREDAKDLMQQTLLTGFRFFYTFEAGTDFGAWIYMVMKNQFLNHQRSLKTSHSIPQYQLRTIDDEERPYYLNNLSLSVPAYHYEELFCDEVSIALDQLSPENEEILIMADVEEISLWEIAERQGIGERTLRSKLRRARNKMLDQLHEFGKAEGYRKGSRLIGASKRQRTTIKALEHEGSMAGA